MSTIQDTPSAPAATNLFGAQAANAPSGPPMILKTGS